jgi:bifunctional glutamyl/prolyl-tRNA synthetase
MYCKIIEKGNLVRKMKYEKDEKEIVDDELKTLLDLKGEYKSVKGKEWKNVKNEKKNVMEMKDKKGRKKDNEIDDMNMKIKDKGKVVRKLKYSGADKNAVDAGVKKILDIKEK